MKTLSIGCGSRASIYMKKVQAIRKRRGEGGGNRNKG